MHFTGISDGYGIGAFALVLMLGALALSVARYNLRTRPLERRELAEAREAEAREHAAQHELDVPVARPGRDQDGAA